MSSSLRLLRDFCGLAGFADLAGLGDRTHLLARDLDQLRIRSRRTVAQMVFRQPVAALGVVNGIESESGCEGSPFIVIEQRPVQITDQRDIGADDVHYLFDMHS